MLAINKYCLVRDNEDLRLLLLEKMKQQGVSFGKLARELNLDRGNINQWLSNINSKSINQFNAIRVARYLGVEVGLEIRITK